MTATVRHEVTGEPVRGEVSGDDLTRLERALAAFWGRQRARGDLWARVAERAVEDGLL